MSLSNRLKALELAAQPDAGPVRYVSIYPDGDPFVASEYEKSRPGWQPRLTSKEEAQARYPGENLFFIIVRHDRRPIEPNHK